MRGSGTLWLCTSHVNTGENDAKRHCAHWRQAASQLARLALALAAAQAVAHAESLAWQLLAHTPFMREPRTPLMPQAWALVAAVADAFFR